MTASQLQRELAARPAWCLNLIGAGGSGKTSKAYWLLDHWFSSDNIFAYKMPPYVREALPERMRSRFSVFDDFGEIAGKEGIVFLDDVAINFLSRSSGATANKDLIASMTIARHNGWRFLITSQNSILIDKGILESLDQFTLRCRMTDSQTLTERDEFVEVQVSVNELIADIVEGMEYDAARGFCFCPETDELFLFQNWEGMNETLSKPFKGGYVSGGKLVI